MFAKIKAHLPALFLVSGAVLRIAGTGAAAIWTDEAVTLYRSRLPFLLLWQNHAEQSGDILMEALVRWQTMFSTSVWALRLPSLLAGLACLWLVWLLMQRLDFNPTQQTITAVLVAFAPGLIWDAQNARPYSLLAFFFLLALYFLLESRWLAFGLSLSLMCYTHNIAPAFVLAAGIIAWLLYPTRFRLLATTSCIVFLSYIPQFLLIFQNQQWISMQIAPLPAFSLNWFVMSLIQAFWATTITDALTVLLALLVLLLTLGLVFTRLRARGRWVPALAAAIPFTVIFLASALFTNIFVYRAIIPMFLPFFLWLGWELGLKGWKLSYRSVLAGLWIWLVVTGFALFHPADRGGYLDHVAAEIRDHWQPGDMLVITTVTGLPFDYYLQDLPMEYLPISDNFFLQPPGLDLIIDRQPATVATRLWVIVPDDVLLDADAHARAEELTLGAPPIYRVTYMQTSPLEVYLINK